MIFRKLTSGDHQSVMDYLRQDPEFNIFIIGDIENYGYETFFQTIWGVTDYTGKIKGILLRYYTFYIPYSYDQEVLQRFSPLIDLGATMVSGKKEIIDIVKKSLQRRIIKEKQDCFACLKKLNSLEPDPDLGIKKADLDDVDRLINLRKQIVEFSTFSLNQDSIVQKLNGKGRVYYLEDSNGEMISTASTSAESSQSAMIIGVATLPLYRRRGLVTNCVYYLCRDLLAEGKIACLFYDNPEAGKIYHRLGFVEIGKWSMLQLESCSRGCLQ
jgi:uncharacterized protein